MKSFIKSPLAVCLMAAMLIGWLSSYGKPLRKDMPTAVLLKWSYNGTATEAENRRLVKYVRNAVKIVHAELLMGGYTLAGDDVSEKIAAAWDPEDDAKSAIEARKASGVLQFVVCDVKIDHARLHESGWFASSGTMEVSVYDYTGDKVYSSIVKNDGGGDTVSAAEQWAVYHMAAEAGEHLAKGYAEKSRSFVFRERKPEPDPRQEALRKLLRLDDTAWDLAHEFSMFGVHVYTSDDG